MPNELTYTELENLVKRQRETICNLLFLVCLESGSYKLCKLPMFNKVGLDIRWSK